MSTRNHLFSQNEWSMVAAQQRSRLEDELGSFDGDRLLNTSINDLCTYFVEKYTVTVPTLHTNQIVAEQREAQIEIGIDRNRYLQERGRSFLSTGTLVEFSVPFDGDPECFSIQPTTFTFNAPRGDVYGNTLILHVEGVNLVTDTVRNQVHQSLADIAQNLKYLQSDAGRFNGNLYSYAHALIEQRRKKLLTDRNLVSALGYKLKERASDDNAESPPYEREKLYLLPPEASTLPYKPEPLLLTKDYARIIEVFQRSAHQLSFSPLAISTMNEAALRAYCLIQLNAQFEGKGTGEIFTFESESDIRIFIDGKNIFIAECKLWQDAQGFTDGLQHLLSYPCWRDTKAAYILVNRADNFLQVIEAIREAAIAHSNFKRQLPQLSETAYPYVFAHNDDRNREMLLTILAVDATIPE